MLRILAKLFVSHMHISNILFSQEKYKGNFPCQNPKT